MVDNDDTAVLGDQDGGGRVTAGQSGMPQAAGGDGGFTQAAGGDDSMSQAASDIDELQAFLDKENAGSTAQAPSAETSEGKKTREEDKKARKEDKKARKEERRKEKADKQPKGSSRVPGIVVRIAFAFVFIVNVWCAFSFVFQPNSYVDGFELSSAPVPGAVAVQGLGIAFLMWNATYPAVIVSPRRFRSLAIVVIVQQIIGLVGEWWLVFSIPSHYSTLIGSITRFGIFDAIGLVLMLGTLIWFCVNERRKRREEKDGRGASR